MTRESAMFVAGPPVVKRLGQDLSKQELGGADIQTRAGGVDDAVDTRRRPLGARGASSLPAILASTSCRRRFPATTIRSAPKRP